MKILNFLKYIIKKIIFSFYDQYLLINPNNKICLHYNIDYLAEIYIVVISIY